MELTPREQKLLLRLYRYPGLGFACLAGAFLVLVPWFLYEMIEGVFVKVETGRGAIDVMFFLMIAFVIVLVVLFVFLVLYARIKAIGKEHKKIEEKLQTKATGIDVDYARVTRIAAEGAAGRFLDGHSKSKAGETAGKALQAAAAVESVAAVGDITAQMTGSAEEMCKAAGIEIPKRNPLPLLVILGPTLLLIAIGTALILSDVNVRREKEQQVTAHFYRLAENFSYCEDVRWDDVKKKDMDSHEKYDFRATLHGSSVKEYFSSLRLTMDWNGVVDEVTYTCYFDKDGDYETQVRQCKEDYATLWNTLAEKKIPLKDPAVAEADGFSEEVYEALLAGDMYTEYKDDVKEDGIRIFRHFDTKPEQEMNDYTYVYLWIGVESR